MFENVFVNCEEVSMRFGHFDDEHREYVIDTPKTPLPWINYLGSKDFSV